MRGSACRTHLGVECAQCPMLAQSSNARFLVSPLSCCGSNGWTKWHGMYRSCMHMAARTHGKRTDGSGGTAQASTRALPLDGPPAH
eukprot:CAMPEP_0183534308 /NCGR_PEP_ID=MMETSP0371-20130417/26795_1 /TAXON_ID=268820 /ORGANISM="Peridinium aciculiferum, Strain PAER-2" /LENGTH=85 /DNA_ID=CAMNT_0025734659 /DNA_START=79 /DNA_END=336 /DNA_ORIENTATION=-